MVVLPGVEVVVVVSKPPDDTVEELSVEHEHRVAARMVAVRISPINLTAFISTSKICMYVINTKAAGKKFMHEFNK